MTVDTANYLTLSAMITPALFLTANGSLIISTSNRMSRVVDRVRVLLEVNDKLCRGTTDLDFVAERRAHTMDQIRHLEWRSDQVRNALTLLYVALTTFVGTSLTLAIDALFNNALPAVPTTLAILGVCLMLAASVNLIREARYALRSNREEIQFYRKLQERRMLEGHCMT